MLVVRTPECRAYSLGQLPSRQQPVGLDHPSLAVDPLGLYQVELRALFRQNAAYDPHSFAARFDPPVVGGYPLPDLAAYMPGGVVPYEEPHLLAGRFELLAAPRKEAGRYPAHRAAIHKAQPHLLKLRQIKPIAGDGLRIRIVLSNRLLDQTHGLTRLHPAIEGGQSQPTPPTLVTETNRPGVGMIRRQAHQPVAPPFFYHTLGQERLSTVSPAPSAPHPR